jgi:hypothetical protein
MIYGRVSAPAAPATLVQQYRIALPTDTLLGGDCFADLLYLYPAALQVLHSVSVPAAISWRGAQDHVLCDCRSFVRLGRLGYHPDRGPMQPSTTLYQPSGMYQYSKSSGQ